jgi:hypothetical protein
MPKLLDVAMKPEKKLNPHRFQGKAEVASI